MTASEPERQQLRREIKARRAQLQPVERIDAAGKLRHSLEQLPEFMVDDRVAGYWACGGELPLNLAIAGFAEREQQFHLPIIGADHKMLFAPWHTQDDVTPNRYGIPEPADASHAVPASLVDVVLVPLLGFDRQGNRLGMGGGYYDRTFAFLQDEERPATPLLVGIGYAFQERTDLVPQTWDVPMDYIATDQELIDCTEPATA